MTTGTSPSPGRAADQAARLRELVDELMADTVDGSNTTDVTIEPTPRAAIAPASTAPSEPAHATEPQPTTPGKIVAITSGKGGVGKTFTSVNLSIAIARLGCRVTLVDADPGLANADVICGLAPTRRLGDSGREPRTLADLAIRVPGGFDLIPGAVGPVTSDSSAFAADPPERRLAHGLRELALRNEVVFIDTGAGLSSDVTTVTSLADLVLIVVTPEPTSMADAYALIKCLRSLPAAAPGSPNPRPRLGLIVNQAASRAEASAVHARLSAVCERFLFYSPALMGVISLDERIPRSIRARRPLLADDPGDGIGSSSGGPARREIAWLSLRLASELGLSRSKPHQHEGLIARWRRLLTRGPARPHEELT